MVLITKTRKRLPSREDGLTLIELLIAMIVLAVGILGSMSLVIMAIKGDYRSKQMSNSTTIAQMLTEKMMSVPANSSPTLTITDCTGTSSSIATAPGGETTTSSGDIDFTAATVTNYNMLYTDCGSSGSQMVYDVRWNVQQLSAYSKLLTASARLKFVITNGLAGSVYSPVVTIHTVVGLGT
jgi:prepilin-type N-terminal cleavage/methylation domain-containing protein